MIYSSLKSKLLKIKLTLYTRIAILFITLLASYLLYNVAVKRVDEYAAIEPQDYSQNGQQSLNNDESFGNNKTNSHKTDTDNNPSQDDSEKSNNDENTEEKTTSSNDPTTNTPISSPIPKNPDEPAPSPSQPCPSGQSGTPPDCVANPVLPLGVAGSWQLKFSDEFDSLSLDLNKWRPNWLAGSNTAITKPINSAELSCYDPAQVSQGSGVLTLSAVQRQCTANNGITYNYASGIIQSYNHYRFTYGYAESKIWIDGDGGAPVNWPAFWINGTGQWPTTGEIDIMEVLSGNPPFCWHFHYSGGSQGACKNLSPSNTGWHVFGAWWQPNSITYYYDGTEVGKVTSNVTGSEMYVIANLGISTEHGGPLRVPATMKIDYIRAWQ